MHDLEDRLETEIFRLQELRCVASCPCNVLMRRARPQTHAHPQTHAPARSTRRSAELTGLRLLSERAVLASQAGCDAPQRGRPIRCRCPLWRRAWTALMRSELWKSVWAVHVKKKYESWSILKDWALHIGTLGMAYVEIKAHGCKADVLRHSKVMLCTIASTSRLLREWEENCQEPLHTHTVHGSNRCVWCH